MLLEDDKKGNLKIEHQRLSVPEEHRLYLTQAIVLLHSSFQDSAHPCHAILQPEAALDSGTLLFGTNPGPLVHAGAVSHYLNLLSLQLTTVLPLLCSPFGFVQDPQFISVSHTALTESAGLDLLLHPERSPTWGTQPMAAGQPQQHRLDRQKCQQSCRQAPLCKCN